MTALITAALLVVAPLPAAETDGAPASRETPRFREAAAELGIDFVHRHFGTGEKTMPENMAPGLALFDYDGDGLLDLYLVQGAPLPAPGERTAAPLEPEEARTTAINRLLRGLPEGGFEDVTDRAGVGDRGYGMGVAFGDTDGDGDLDLYVTNFGPNVLYRNRGDGTFENATDEAGVACPRWSVGSGFFDPDGDGDLDLYVANYLDFSFENNKWCGNARAGIRAYCHPEAYAALPDCFYRNVGDGRFAEAAESAGVLFGRDAVGLGVAFADLDGDGHQDVFVANDARRNHLYLGDGAGRFLEGALPAGVALNAAGEAESSMGVEIGDVDGDGLPEIFLTHLDGQSNTLYRNLGGGRFADATEAAGLAAPSFPWVGFGTVLLDHDLDGDLDLFVANGHILDNIARFDPSRSHRQPCQLFDNLGDGRFREITASLGFAEPLVGRGAVGGDVDGDGDIDLVVSQNGGRAVALINRLGAGRGWLAARLIGRASNRPGFGAQLELAAGSRRQARLLNSATSYASQGPPQAHFGLGAARLADELTVHWPSGRTVRYRSLPAGRLYTLAESGAGPAWRKEKPAGPETGRP